MLDRVWIDGIVVLDGSVLRNIFVHNVPADLIAGVTAEADAEPKSELADGEGA